MTLPTTGAISTAMIVAELGSGFGPAGTQFSLDSVEGRYLAGIPSGAISLQNFRGKKAANISIVPDTANISVCKGADSDLNGAHYVTLTNNAPYPTKITGITLTGTTGQTLSGSTSTWPAGPLQGNNFPFIIPGNTSMKYYYHLVTTTAAITGNLTFLCATEVTGVSTSGTVKSWVPTTTMGVPTSISKLGGTLNFTVTVSNQYDPGAICYRSWYTNSAGAVMAGTLGPDANYGVNPKASYASLTNGVNNFSMPYGALPVGATKWWVECYYNQASTFFQKLSFTVV